jgi:SAM-dependent methyltransferase
MAAGLPCGVTLRLAQKFVKKDLLEFLACPATGGRLRLVDVESSPSGEIIGGKLVGPAGREYPIVEGVPVMLMPETWPPGQAETRESFSSKWKLAPNYRESTLQHYRQWYLDRYGLKSIDGLEKFLASKRFILDAGTGHGRDAEMFEKASSANVFAIDISYGIHNAYRDLHGLERMHLVQGDLTRLPFPPEFFDFISCDQVIHHTPDTHASLLALLKHLAPGGHIAFYTYKVKGPIRELTDDYIRQFTVNYTPEQCYEFSEAVTKLGKALSDLKVELEVPQDIPLLEIKAGRYDIQRFIYWNFMKCYWNDTMDWTSNVITNFDWYHPLHAHRHTPDEVRSWVKESDLEIVHFDVVESGISVLARKPK